MQATREYLSAQIPSLFKREIRLGKSRAVLAMHVRGFLHMNHYEPWDDADIAKLIEEVIPTDAPAPPSLDGDEPDEEKTEASGDKVPELLPFSKFPGYLFDAWGVPYRAKGPRRKEGKVKLENYFYPPKGGGSPHHIARYRLSVDGKQKPFYPRYLMRARLHAEQEWRREEDGS